jgi:hypothetical protein
MKRSGYGLENREKQLWGSAALITRHDIRLPAKVGTKFATSGSRSVDIVRLRNKKDYIFFDVKHFLYNRR